MADGLVRPRVPCYASDGRVSLSARCLIYVQLTASVSGATSVVPPGRTGCSPTAPVVSFDQGSHDIDLGMIPVAGSVGLPSLALDRTSFTKISASSHDPESSHDDN
jgi:hypothetical protein